MSEFITTMAARATGEIPRVEPLISSMFLALPAMPSDYTEDMFAEPEPPESLEDDPDLSFLPLLNYDPWSVEIPNWYENDDFEVEETEGENSLESLQIERTNRVESPQDLPETLAINNTPDGNPDTEIKIIESEVILREENREWQSKEEASNYSATPQGNSLDSVSPSVEANVELNPLVSTAKSELPQVSNDNQLNISRKLTDVENGEINTSANEDKSSNITSQINRSDVISKSIEANINSNSSFSNTESELTTESNYTSLNISKKRTDLEHQETHTSSSNEIESTITPQINRLEAASSSLQANIDSNLSIHNTESESATPSNENQVKSNQQLTNRDNRDTRTSSTDEISPNITTQVNRLETTSSSLRANVDSNPSISNTESKLNTASEENQGKVNKKSTNLDNQDSHTSSTDEISTTITTQVNRLETTSPSLQANLDSNPSISNTQSELTTPSDNNQLVTNSKVAGLDNNKITSSAKPKFNQFDYVDSNSDLTKISDDNSLNITKELTNLEHQKSNTSQVKANSQLTNLANENTYTSSQEDKSSNITSQINRLETKSISAQASLDSHTAIPNKDSDLNKVSDDHSLHISNEFTDLDNGEVHIASQDETSPTITPQVHRLESASSSLQANVESNPSILNTELDSTKASDDNQATTNNKVNSSENSEITSSTIIDATSSAITPQINRLEQVSQSVKANVESHPSIANPDYDLIQSFDDYQEKLNYTLTHRENKEAYTSSQEDKKSSTVTPQVNRLDATSISPQANLDSRSSIVNKASELTKVDSDTQAKENQKLTNLEHRAISTSFQNEREEVSKANIESSQNQEVNKINKQGKVNPDSGYAPESNSFSDNNNNSLISPLRQLGKLINRHSRKQKPKQSDLTRKNFGEKTVTPNLQNNDNFLVSSQGSSNLQEQKLSHINSVKPDLKSDASYSLPNTTLSDNTKIESNAKQSNSPKIQRSPLNSPPISQSPQTNQLNHGKVNSAKLPQQKITPQQTVEARLNQSANIISDSTSTTLNSERSLGETEKLQSPVSQVSQSSNSPQQNSFLSNLHNVNSNLNSVKNAHNPKYIPNSVSKNEFKLNSSYSSIKPNLNEDTTVINNQEIPIKLSPPKVTKLSSANNPTESRRNQSESPSSPTIQITIGRIEVRVTQPPPSPKSTTRKLTKRNPSLSLQDYLKQRDGK